MKRIIFGALMGTLLLMIAGCGQTKNDTAETTTVMETTQTTEATTETTEAIEDEKSEPITVEASYDAPKGYDDYMVMSYYFEETDEDIAMTVGTDTAHSKYHVHFDFFGEEQVLEFEVTDGVPTVVYDKSGFIGKDVEKIYAAVMEVKDWMAIEAVNTTSEIEASYDAPEGYDEYMVMSYYFEETDEDIAMTVGTDATHSKYHVHFDFFGEEQVLEFEVTDGVSTVVYDKSGFIGKDVEKIYAAILEVKDWMEIN